MTRVPRLLTHVPFTLWAVTFFVLYLGVLEPLAGSRDYDDGGLGTLMFWLLEVVPGPGWMFSVSHELLTEFGVNGARTLEWVGGFVIAGAADGVLALVRREIRRRRERDG